MATLTIYLDEETLDRVESAARSEGSSVSGWARRHLDAACRAGSEWPADFFDLFGSAADDPSFEAPEEIAVPLRTISLDD